MTTTPSAPFEKRGTTENFRTYQGVKLTFAHVVAWNCAIADDCWIAVAGDEGMTDEWIDLPDGTQHDGPGNIEFAGSFYPEDSGLGFGGAISETGYVE